MKNLPTIRVLVVDDETQITRLAKEVLSRYCMEVHTETDSVQACKLFLDDPLAFDVLITDQMMPGRKGTELARQVLSCRPDLPVVLCTGYADSMTFEQAAEIGIREYVLKPLDFGHLAKMLRGWFTEAESAGSAC